MTWQNYVRNYFKRLRDPLVTHYHISCLPSPVSRLSSPVFRLPSPVSRLSSITSHLPSPVSRLLSLVSLLPSLVSLRLHPPPLFTPLPLKPRCGGERLAASRGGGWPLGREGRIWPQEGVEDDRAGRRGVSLKKDDAWRQMAITREKNTALTRDASIKTHDAAARDAATKIWCMPSSK